MSHCVNFTGGALDAPTAVMSLRGTFTQQYMADSYTIANDAAVQGLMLVPPPLL